MASWSPHISFLGRGDHSEPGGEAPILWFRVVVIAALIASVGITWPLWNVRDAPPLLPALDLSQFSLGTPLIVATLATLFAPVPGITAVSALICYGMLTDQTRMQPEFFSLPILLWGTLPSPSARLIARAHLVALWFYAGVHKLASPALQSDTGPRWLTAALPGIPVHLLTIAAVFIGLAEIATALLAIWPPTRWLAAWSALLVHGGILVALATSGEWQNIAVWPWNIALACSGLAFISPWKMNLTAALRSVPFPARATAVILALAPLGFYLGLVDAYPAHQLYSSAVARATVYCPAGCRPEQDVNATWYALNVPLPPEPRLFSSSFVKTCAVGDVLRIDLPRTLRSSDAKRAIIQYCPSGSLPAAHP